MDTTTHTCMCTLICTLTVTHALALTCIAGLLHVSHLDRYSRASASDVPALLGTPAVASKCVPALCRTRSLCRNLWRSRAVGIHFRRHVVRQHVLTVDKTAVGGVPVAGAFAEKSKQDERTQRKHRRHPSVRIDNRFDTSQRKGGAPALSKRWLAGQL